MAPLTGTRVLDFSALLPGALATLILSEAGAEVIKVERAGAGDEMRSREPRFGATSASFAMLNGGKRSIAVDLKNAADRDRLLPLIANVDVLVDSYRPGVMERLGLGCDSVRRINPRIIYCALTGYGQSGTKADLAGHDINYLAQSGISSLVTGAGGVPPVPAAPFADIGGGTFPLVINILLALMQREKTGKGCFLDVAIADGMMSFCYTALARGFSSSDWPAPDAQPLTGALARYRHYRTRDNRFIAVGALEEKFWSAFCDLIALPAESRDDRKTPDQSIRAVTEIMLSRDAAEWEQLFAGHDVCCTLVKTMEEAGSTVDARYGVASGAQTMPALPLPVARHLRHEAGARTPPALGEANALLEEDACQRAS